MVFRHFALKAKHERAVALAQAAEAAARQDAFWAFHDALYADQGRLDDPHLWARCEALGLDLDRFQADRRDPAIAERVRRDVRDALRAGATTTPTLFEWPVAEPARGGSRRPEHVVERPVGALHAPAPRRGLSTLRSLDWPGSDSVRDTTEVGDRRPARKGSTYEH